MNQGSERGSTTVLVMGLTLVVFAVAGLAVDGTRAFIYRRSLQNLADAAATAAASELDENLFYRSKGERFVVDRERAYLLASSFVTGRGYDVDADVHVEADSVTVALRGSVRPLFLSLVAIDEIPVGAVARAAPVPGRRPGPHRVNGR